MEISYRDNTAEKNDIVAHFKSCTPEFYASLSGRVNIEDYSEKIAEKSYTHEAWVDNRLVGLLAIYYNGVSAEFNFITNMSLASEFMGQGIGSHLMKTGFAKSRADGAKTIRLDVEIVNEAALQFYQKFGFYQVETRGSMVVLAADI